VTATGNGGATVKRRWSVSRWTSQPTHMMKFSRDSTMHVATSRRMREASREAPRAACLAHAGHTAQRRAVQLSAAQHSTMYTAQNSRAQHKAPQCNARQHSTAQQSPAQGGTAQRKATAQRTWHPPGVVTAMHKTASPPRRRMRQPWLPQSAEPYATACPFARRGECPCVHQECRQQR
jgi:hypothetical protein